MLTQLGERCQRTLTCSASVSGIGYVTGKTITATFHPAAANTGIQFQRLDKTGLPRLAAHIDNVSGANRRTVLGHAPHQIELVEHCLAALAGLRIDNCLVELTGSELPGLDGSALGFIEALANIPLETQSASRPIYTVPAPVQVTDGKATLTLHPAESRDLIFSYCLDYGRSSPLGRQIHTQRIDPTECLNGLFDNRTFLLEAEAAVLRQQGLGANATLESLLIFGPHGPLGNALRHENEPARHKVLDMVGDLSLLGCDLAGHLVGCKSGHALNTQLVRELAKQLPRQAHERIAA